MELSQEVNHLLMSCKDKEHIKNNKDYLSNFFTKQNNISALKLALTTKKNFSALKIIEQLRLTVTPYMYINRYTFESLYWLNRMKVLPDDEFELLSKKFWILKDFDQLLEKTEKNFILLQIEKSRRKNNKLRYQSTVTYLEENHLNKEFLLFQKIEAKKSGNNNDIVVQSGSEVETDKSDNIVDYTTKLEGNDEIHKSNLDKYSNKSHIESNLSTIEPVLPSIRNVKDSLNIEQVVNSNKFKEFALLPHFSIPNLHCFLINIDSLVEIDQIIEPFKDFTNQVFKTDMKTFEEFPNDTQKIQKINKFKDIKMNLVNSQYRSFSQFFHLSLDMQNKIENLMKIISRVRKAGFKYYIISRRPLQDTMTFCYLFVNSLDLTKVVEILPDGKLPFTPNGKTVLFGKGGIDFLYLKKACSGLDRFLD